MLKRGGGYAYSSGFVILSTSKDSQFMTDVECLMLHVGGEPIVAIG